MSSFYIDSSDLLSDLFDRIVEKDDVDEATAAFGDVADHTIILSDYTPVDLIELGADIAEEADGRSIFSYESNEDDAGYAALYLFYAKSEAAAYNRALRSWCENTGRTVKSKKKKK